MKQTNSLTFFILILSVLFLKSPLINFKALYQLKSRIMFANVGDSTTKVLALKGCPQEYSSPNDVEKGNKSIVDLSTSFS